MSNQLRKMANAVRSLALDMVQNAKSGHSGMPLGMADVITVLYKDFLRFNPINPLWSNRDRFILSNGHGSALLYAVLYLLDYISVEDIKNFRKLHSITPGHPEYHPSIGIETTTGPLGQGLGNAVGMAISQKVAMAKQDNGSHSIFAFVGDGCLQEGISHEVASLAGHLQLNNLIVFFDDNNITIDGDTDLSCSDDVTARFQSYGWEVLAIDGHDYEQIHTACNQAMQSNKPVLIRCYTIIGYGVKKFSGTAAIHGSVLPESDWLDTKLNLGITSNELFFVTPDAKAYWQEVRKNKLALYQKDVEFEVSSVPAAYIVTQLEKYKENHATSSTRAACGQILSQIVKMLPTIGGSADLTPSNNTKNDFHQAIDKNNFHGNYLHYGIREHGMAAIMNGIALHGHYLPYGGTFLAFSDYMRPAIRLAAMMGIKVVYIFTHDSIGVGEDGPTHQPIEQLTSLRAIPNLLVIRPADHQEVVESWQIIAFHQGPVALILSRQTLPNIRMKQGCIITNKQNNVQLGCYLLYACKKLGNTQVTIFASGSEVSLAVQVADLLHEQNINVEVYSVPAASLYWAKEKRYNFYGYKVAIEASNCDSWWRFIGEQGELFNVTTFGASGALEDVYQYFSLTAESIAGKIINLIAIPNITSVN